MIDEAIISMKGVMVVEDKEKKSDIESNFVATIEKNGRKGVGFAKNMLR